VKDALDLTAKEPEVTLGFDNNSMEDLWIVVTWKVED